MSLRSADMPVQVPNSANRSRTIALTYFGGLSLLLTCLAAISSIAITSYLRLGYLSQLSFRVDDPPWMPDDFSGQTDSGWLGDHFFGDLFIYWGYASVPDPYSLEYAIPAQIPALGILLYRLIFIFGPITGLVLNTLLTLLLPYLVITQLLQLRDFASRIIWYSAFVLLSASLFIVIDRGGAQLIAYSLAALSLVALSKNKLVTFTLLLILAVALKPYILLILIFVAFRKSWRIAIASGAVVLAANVLSFALVGNGIVPGIRAMLNSQTTYMNSEVIASYAVKFGTSLYGAAIQTSALLVGEASAVSTFSSSPRIPMVLAFSWLLVTTCVIAWKVIPNWIALIFGLSCFQMTVAATGPYGTSWCFIGAAVFLSPFVFDFVGSGQNATGDSDRISFAERASALAIGSALILSTLPVAIGLSDLGIQYGWQAAARGLISPLAWIFALIVTVIAFSVQSVVKRSRT